MVRGEMLDEYERHAALRRHLREELLERFQTACGRAQAHDETRRARHPCRLGPLSSRWYFVVLLVHIFSWSHLASDHVSGHFLEMIALDGKADRFGKHPRPMPQHSGQKTRICHPLPREELPP